MISDAVPGNAGNFQATLTNGPATSVYDATAVASSGGEGKQREEEIGPKQLGIVGSVTAVEPDKVPAHAPLNPPATRATIEAIRIAKIHRLDKIAVRIAAFRSTITLSIDRLFR
ncbi:MAG: hypothetical protein HQ478_06295 [Chloroflexi bacterium]|nr:hypothetical protein [Chloroflexota bacterium]